MKMIQFISKAKVFVECYHELIKYITSLFNFELTINLQTIGGYSTVIAGMIPDTNY